MPVSPEFRAAVQRAIEMASYSSDEAYVFMASARPDGKPEVPVYIQYAPTQQQARSGGCPSCVYLGLWADRWPGYPTFDHGSIWLFESGIRTMGGDLTEQTYMTLTHEYDHALQRDHVLEAMNKQKLAGMQVQARGFASSCRPCTRP